jgi:CheY-like chemotaxis protein
VFTPGGFTWMLEATNMARLPILLIEDNEAESEALSALLERFDYHSEVVPSGEQALSRLSEARFAAVLIDLELPKVDGLDCVRKIRDSENAFRLAVPIIGFTGRREAAELLLAEPNGIVAYLGKPPEAEELRRLLLRFVYDPDEPNLKTLRPISDLKDWCEKRTGTN